jgi:DNA processing protein
MKDFRYLYYLTRVEGLGSVRIKYLLERFGNAENVFGASQKDICDVENISDKTAESVLNAQSRFDDYSKDYGSLLEKIEKSGLDVITYDDGIYPDLLKKIYDPPVILYFRGKYLKNNFINCISIVGTRKPTDYGREVTRKFATELSSLGLSVVSGFARGIDTVAHKSVLDNHDAKAVTCAIMGCGVDVIYPPENKKLYNQMIEKGIIMSEYEPGTTPDKGNFPKRNRIISGISLGTIIVESDNDGGAMITARSALDQCREVFAVPGKINSRQSAGTNNLIKNSSAKLVESVQDVIDEIKNKLSGINFNLNGKPSGEIPDLKGPEMDIYTALLSRNEAIHIDTLAEECGLNISGLLVTLLEMEFKGYIEQLPGKRFKIK